MQSCTFCRIGAREEPAEILYEDDEVLAFRNRLRWVPVMLLVVPKEHIAQEELWRRLGRVGFRRVVRGLVRLGVTVPMLIRLTY